MTQPTKDRLAAELTKIGAFDMAALAAQGHYDDYLSPLDMPIFTLAQDLARLASPTALALRRRVMAGEFDGTKEEAEAWAKSPEGLEAFDQFGRPLIDPAEQRKAELAGEDPIEPAFRAQMNGLASGLDEVLNGDAKGQDRKVGFCLFMFAFGESDRVNYISNAARPDMIAAVEAWLTRAKAAAP